MEPPPIRADTPGVDERAGEEHRGPRTDEELCEFRPAPLSPPLLPAPLPSDGWAQPTPPPLRRPALPPPAASSSSTTASTPMPSPRTTAAAMAPRLSASTATH